MISICKKTRRLTSLQRLDVTYVPDKIMYIVDEGQLLSCCRPLWYEFIVNSKVFICWKIENGSIFVLPVTLPRVNK